MNDSDLLRAFEQGELRPSTFGHREHVRLAWILLQDGDLASAYQRFSRGLRQFAARHGQSGRYHETLTWAWLVVINTRMAQADSQDTWESFARRNPDLLRDAGRLLARHYSPELLASRLARTTFVLPDRVPGGDLQVRRKDPR